MATLDDVEYTVDDIYGPNPDEKREPPKKPMNALRLAHIADIHVRDTRRDEYAAIFAKLYDSLKTHEPDIIVVAGDVYETKSHASPNNIRDVVSLLTNLTKIAPVVMITGNHDTNVKKPGALDLLTVTIANNPELCPPRLTYYRNSGVYAFHGVVWTVFATDGPKVTLEELEEKLASGDLDVKDDAVRICLFHDEVTGAKFPNGVNARPDVIQEMDFIPYDATLGGHIHLRQGGPRWRYSGSLIQQNIGEPHVGHGYLIWDITKSANTPGYRTALPEVYPIDLPNDRGFLTMEYADGKDITPQPIPTRPAYYRLKFDARTTSAQRQRIEKELTRRFGAAPRKYDTMATASPSDEKKLNEIKTDAMTFETHEEIIRTLLGDSEHADAVVKMHKEAFDATMSDGYTRERATIRLLNFKFSNLFCFGKDNEIDFTKMEGGLQGLIAANATGKSYLIDAIVYALYGKVNRGTKTEDLVNDDAKSYSFELQFEKDGKTGVIKREGDAGGKHSNQSKYTFTFDGEDLTSDKDEKETTERIRKVVGDYEIAQLTSIAHQNSKFEFIDMSEQKRKHYLEKLLSFGAFETVLKDVNNKLKDAKTQERSLQKRFAGKTLDELEDELTTSGGNAEDLEMEIKTLDAKMTKAAATILTLTRQSEEARTTAAGLKRQLEDTPTMAPSDHEKNKKDLKTMLDELEVTTRQEIETQLDMLKDVKAIDKAKTKLKSWNELQDLRRKGSTTVPDEQLNAHLAEIADLKKTAEMPRTPLIVLGERPWETARMPTTKHVGPTADDQKKARQVIADAGTQFTLTAAAMDTELDKCYADQPPKPKQSEKPNEYAELERKLATIGNNPQSQDRTAEFNEARAALRLHEKAVSQLPAELKAKLQQLPSDQLKKLAECKETVKDADAKIALAENGMNQLPRLKLCPTCPGCQNVKNLFSANALERAKDQKKRATVAETARVIQHHEQLKEKLAEAKLALDAQAWGVRKLEIETEREQHHAYTQWQETIATLKSLRTAIQTMELAAGIWEENKRANAKREVEHRMIDKAKKELMTREKQYAELLTNAAAKKEYTEHASVRKQRLEQARRLYDQVETEVRLREQQQKNAKIREEYKAAQDSYLAKETQLDKARVAMESLKNQQSKKRERMIEEKTKAMIIQTQIDAERERSTEEETLKVEIAILEKYKEVLNPQGGIGDVLLERARPRLQEIINSILAESEVPYDIELNKKFEPRFGMNDPQVKRRKMRCASGSQRFIIAMTLRRAMWRIATCPVLDACFLDEGFCTLDEPNLDATYGYLERTAGLPSLPRLHLLITHIRKLQDSLDHALTIT
ncbi:MAG: AAA family ATPase, partial [Patescibacteria group bacterium]|nr:AAA family ATPase [Patescibacteria group bacterium]